MARPPAFAKRMRKIGTTLGKASNALGAQAGIAIGASLIKDTPIDTGAAKSNWQASRINPKTGTRDAFARGRYGDTELANETAAIAQIIQQFKARKNNQQLFLTNNLDYIGLLESSYHLETVRRKKPKPPARYTSGFVRVALQKGRETIRNTRLIRQALRQAGASGFSIEVR